MIQSNRDLEEVQIRLSSVDFSLNLLKNLIELEIRNIETDFLTIKEAIKRLEIRSKSLGEKE